MDTPNEKRPPLTESPDMPPWPALAPYARTKRVPSNGDELFYYDTGPRAEGFSIILIHGLGDEADSWRSLIPRLSGAWRVAALDLPGFGRSRARGRASFERHAAAVSALLDETGPAVLVGSSMGAAIAERAAFRSQDLVAGLALLDGGLPGRDRLSLPMLALLAPGIGERGYRAFRKEHEAAYRSLYPYYADLEALPEEDRAFLRDRVVARVESDSQMRAYFESLRSYVFTAVFRGAEFRRGLAAFAGPVLIGRGERDRIVSPESTRALSEIRPEAETVVFSGAGHLPHQEACGAVAESLESFLLRIGKADRGSETGKATEV